jgi:HEAT repeat protein
VRAASAWALSRYNDSHNALIGTSRDVRIESLAAAINDEEWFVRYYVALSLATSDDPRAIQPILNLLEHETNPYVIAASAEAAIKLNSLVPCFR